MIEQSYYCIKSQPSYLHITYVYSNLIEVRSHYLVMGLDCYQARPSSLWVCFPYCVMRCVVGIGDFFFLFAILCNRVDFYIYN